MLLEEAAIAEEALLQPLGIIEPVDADDRSACPRRCAAASRRPSRASSLVAALRELADVDADREGGGCTVRSPTWIVPSAVDRAAELALDIMAEALQPFLGLEADQVVGEHRADQPLVEGQRHQQPARRPGDVEEEADPVLHAALAQLLAERDQMIIVDPDQVVRLDQRRDRLGEALVDPLVAAAEAAVIFGQVDPVVEERPQVRLA